MLVVAAALGLDVGGGGDSVEGLDARSFVRSQR